MVLPTTTGTPHASGHCRCPVRGDGERVNRKGWHWFWPMACFGNGDHTSHGDINTVWGRYWNRSRAGTLQIPLIGLCGENKSRKGRDGIRGVCAHVRSWVSSCVSLPTRHMLQRNELVDGRDGAGGVCEGGWVRGGCHGDSNTPVAPLTCLPGPNLTSEGGEKEKRRLHKVKVVSMMLTVQPSCRRSSVCVRESAIIGPCAEDIEWAMGMKGGHPLMRCAYTVMCYELQVCVTGRQTPKKNHGSLSLPR